MKLIKDLGTKFSQNNSKRKFRYGIYKCFCGNEVEALTHNVKSGRAKSCGCVNSRNTTHGMNGHRLYSTWQGMLRRTTTKTNSSYKYYGGRGITVCNDWLKFENFISDMYPSYKEGLTLDRVDNNGNYEKSNCRWATRSTQVQNTRVTRVNNTSGYRGVYFKKANKNWVASISFNRKIKHIGSFKTAIEAAVAYDKYVTEHNLEHTKNGV